jgi:nitrate/nitrite transporter NarK
VLTDFAVRVLGRRWGRTLQGMAAYFLAASFFLIAAVLPPSAGMLAFALICLASFVKDFAMAASWSTTIDIGHRYSGTVAGLMNTIGNLGTVFSPPLVMWLEGMTGSGDTKLYFYSSMFFTASVCWLFINPTRVIVYAPADHRRLQDEGILPPDV